MSIQELETELKGHEAKLVDLTERLNILREKIVFAMKPYIKLKLESLIKDKVANCPEHTLELDEKGLLSDFKKQYLDLLAESDKMVDEAFSNDEVWPHSSYLVDGSVRSLKLYSYKIGTMQIDPRLKSILGKAGEILIKFQYIGPDLKMQNEWLKEDHGTYVFNNSYMHLDIPVELKQFIEEYTSKQKMLGDCLRDIERVKKEVLTIKANDAFNRS